MCYKDLPEVGCGWCRFEGVLAPVTETFQAQGCCGWCRFEGLLALDRLAELGVPGCGWCRFEGLK